MTFKELTGDTAVLKKGGVYRTSPLFEWQGGLFAKFGAGFVRLHADGRSSVDGLSLEQITFDRPLFQDRFGRLCISPGSGRRAVEITGEGRLQIGGPEE